MPPAPPQLQHLHARKPGAAGSTVIEPTLGTSSGEAGADTLTAHGAKLASMIAKPSAYTYGELAQLLDRLRSELLLLRPDALPGDSTSPELEFAALLKESDCPAPLGDDGIRYLAGLIAPAGE